jgi:glycosyltransferase involved in cell wall biosynthesis
LPEAEQRNLLRGAELYAEMLRHVDHAIGSTALITERLGALVAGRAVTVENALDDSLLAAAALPGNREGSGLVTIAYGSGTRTHDSDFALVGGVLARLMAEHPSVRLLVAGPLQIPDGLEPFAGRIVRIPLLGFEDYLVTLARCDISLAPLEAGLFNDAKSNIKFLEASVLGIPSVCSPRAEFQKAVRDGDNGFLAESEDEWHRKLTALIVDPALRQRMGERARAGVLAEYHPGTRTARQLEPVLDAAFPAAGGPGNAAAAPLKVLVVNVHFAPESFGGATCVAEQLSVELAGLPETEVAVFTGTHDPATDYHSLRCFEWKGLPVFAARLPAGGPARGDFDNPTMAGLFGEVLNVVRPDVVHFHSIQMLSATMATACRERDIPYVITLHDAWWVCERQFMVTGDGHYCHQDGVDPLKCVGCTSDAGFTLQRFNYLREILLKAAHLLTPSAFFRELYVKSGVPAGLVSVNKNGVMRPQAFVKKTRQAGPVTFAFVGGYAVHKGYFWLQEIFREIAEDNYRLKIVDLSRKFDLQSVFAEDWPVAGKAEVCEPYTQESIDEFFADVDVLLFPSLWKESFGLSVREALLRDVWVIACDGGGPAEDLRAGVNATVVPMGDTAAFRSALVDLLRNPGKLRGYANPYKDDIRLFREQAIEARTVLARAAAVVRD